MIKNWKDIVNEQIQAIFYSGLYDKTNKINIGCLGQQTQKSILDHMISNLKKFEIVFYREDGGLAEIPILEILQNQAKQDQFLAWYIHTKGVVSGHVGWRKEMEKLVIHQHLHCVKVLENPKIGACGPRFKCTSFPSFNLNRYGLQNCHFSGNFWWAKSNYIKNIQHNLTEIWKANGHSRFMAEAFIGMTTDTKQMVELKWQGVRNEEFDEAYYLEHNPDIKSNSYEHFLEHGCRENRKFKFNPPKICNIPEDEAIKIIKNNMNNPSLYFDEAYYLEHNPDVHNSMKNSGWPSSGYNHFTEHGIHEGRKAQWLHKKYDIKL